MFTLNSNDIVKGLITAVFSGVTMAVLGIIGSATFDLFTADWKKIAALAVAGGIAAGIGYLQKNFLTNNDRHETVAGIIPTK